MLYYLWVAVAGASVALMMGVIGRSSIPLLAGIVPLFPTFTIMAYVLHHYNYKMQDMGQLTLVSIVSALCIIGFNVSMYAFQNMVGFWYSIAISLVVWSVLAYAVYWFVIR